MPDIAPKLNGIKSIYLDTSCLISIARGDEWAAFMKPLIDGIQSGTIDFVASTIVFTEFLPAHQKHDKNLVEIVNYLFDSPSVRMVDVGIGIGKKSRELRVSAGLKSLDAIHLATALSEKVDVFFCVDSDFNVGARIDNTYIAEPYELEDPHLFSSLAPELFLPASQH